MISKARTSHVTTAISKGSQVAKLNSVKCECYLQCLVMAIDVLVAILYLMSVCSTAMTDIVAYKTDQAPAKQLKNA